MAKSEWLVATEESGCRLPVVFVSRTAEGKFPLSISWLASRLKGAAHVLVEESAESCAEIRKLFRINVVYIMIDKEKERRVSFQKRQQAFGPAAKYCLFSYSEWWRYIGPVKPRQPLAQCFGGVGAHLSERPVGPIEQ